MAKKNLAEAAAAILSGNMASLKPMSKGAESFGQAGETPDVATPGQGGTPPTVQNAISTADEAGITKAVAAVGGAKPPGAKPAAAEPMKKSPSQVNEEPKDEDEDKDEDDADEMKDDSDEDEKKDDSDEDEKKSMKEDLDALFNGENLSEDFMKKAATIFEAAVTARANKIEEKLQEQYAEILEEVTEQLKEEMTEKVDDYLNYVVEEWVKDNELAIESGLRSELTEDFIAGLRNLFTEHYIDIPEDKVDVIEEMTSQVVELETKLNEQISSAVEMKKQLNEYAKREAFYEICEGLTSTQIEKMKSLSEGVEFTSLEDYAESLKTLRENYFSVKTASKSNNERLDEEMDIFEHEQSLLEQKQKENKTSADPIMDAYVKSISRTILK
jgi:hypothetical protein